MMNLFPMLSLQTLRISTDSHIFKRIGRPAADGSHNMKLYKTALKISKEKLTRTPPPLNG